MFPGAFTISGPSRHAVFDASSACEVLSGAGARYTDPLHRGDAALTGTAGGKFVPQEVEVFRVL